jgi:hypothetical protein
MQLKTKTFGFIIIGFLLGGVAGVFIGRTYFAGQTGGHRPGRAEIQKQFATRLRLDSLQSARVDSLMESYRQKFGDVQKHYWETIRLKRDTLRLEIRQLLTAKQIGLYDDYIKEINERESRRR